MKRIVGSLNIEPVDSDVRVNKYPSGPLNSRVVGKSYKGKIVREATREEFIAFYKANGEDPDPEASIPTDRAAYFYEVETV
jgi:hypothetical protein